jgi:cytochrome P450
VDDVRVAGRRRGDEAVDVSASPTVDAPTRLRLPPGPGWPTGLQTLALGFAEDRYIAHCRRRFGAVWTERLAGIGTIVAVTDRELGREVLAARGDVLQGGQGRSELEVALGPRSLILVDGQEHLDVRRALTPALHGAFLRAHEAALEEVILAAIDDWHPGPQARVLDVTKRIALDSVLRIVFGITDPGELREAGDRARRVLDLANSTRVTGAALWRRYGALRLVPDYGRAVRRLDRWVGAEIDGRAPGPRAPGTVLQMLRTPDDTGARRMSDAAIRDQVVTLLLAGYETTAATLAWSIDALVHAPEAMRRLEDEVLHSDSAQWTTAVLDETLRLRPPVRFVGRTVAKPFRLGSYDLEPGTRIVVIFGDLHRERGTWADADAFTPERFETAPPPGAYLPFGGGLRRCVGASFSMLEMRIALRELVRRYAFTATGPPSTVLRRGVFYLPRTGVVVGCHPRTGGARD